VLDATQAGPSFRMLTVRARAVPGVPNGVARGPREGGVAPFTASVPAPFDTGRDPGMVPGLLPAICMVLIEVVEMSWS
jgi:hypothetical protein